MGSENQYGACDSVEKLFLFARNSVQHKDDSVTSTWNPNLLLHLDRQGYAFLLQRCGILWCVCALRLIYVRRL